jgi:sulfite reductase alpha subunit-like flavoprotein
LARATGRRSPPWSTPSAHAAGLGEGRSPRRARPVDVRPLYEAGDSLGVYARKNPQLVQAVLDRLGASGEEMVAFDGEALPLRQVLLPRSTSARPSDDCMKFLASRAFNEEDVRH